MKKALFTAAMLLISALPAAAQGTDQPKAPQDCQAMPDSDNGGNGTQKQDGQQSDNLSGSLQPCGGVLKPPPTGDKNAAQPPDNGSQMPVIKPGQVPPQTSK
jgi:hypothetical protein